MTLDPELKKHFDQASKEWKDKIHDDPEAKRLKKLFIETEAKTIIKQEDFFELINIQLDKMIVSEDDTRKTILLISLGGNLTKNAEPTSTNLMVNDDSGAGKDYVVNSVLKILPSEDVIIRKRISEKVFTYWHNAKFEKDWTWAGKIFYNEDISNSVLNSDVFKVMSSSDGLNKSTIVINNMAVDILIRGKPCMIITIALANPKAELLRRYPICNLDTSEEQTKLILKRKALFHEKGIKPSYNLNIKKAISLLTRVNVRVPFASKLVNVLCTKNIIIRTHFDRFIDYIKFSAAIHQFQRERDDKDYVLATEQDYEIGRKALIKTTSNIFSVPLTKNKQKILDIIKGVFENTWFSVGDIEPKISFIGDRQLRKELDKLTDYGFLEKDKEQREEKKKSVIIFRALNLYKIDIPSWENLQNKTSGSSKTSKTSSSIDSKDYPIESNESNEWEVQGTKTTLDILHHRCSKCDLPESHGWDEKGKPICRLCVNGPDEEVVD